MSMQNQLRLSSDIGGVSIQSVINRTGSGIVGQQLTVPAALEGQLTTRTDNDTGVITSEDHGVPDSSKVDVYWEGGARYGMDTSSATSDTFAIDGGAGDNLPDNLTDLTFMVQHVIDVQFDGDNLQLLAAHLDVDGHIGFIDDGDAEQLTLDMVANEAFAWASDTNTTNPLAGHVIESIVVSHGSTSTKNFKLGVLQSNDS